MRLLVVSDVHGNLEALEAVLAAAAGGYDRCLCLGDVVGYGADPQACVARIRDLAALTIRGNHDRACADPAQAADFNPVARWAAEWTHAALDKAALAWLRALPRGPALAEGVQLAHGSPLDEDEYVTTAGQAARALAAAPCPLTLIGHTHLQGGFRATGEGAETLPRPAPRTRLAAEERWLLNPGSVGQPRDRDWRAAYLIYDTEAGAATFYRVAYDLARAQEKIRRARLPESLAARLAEGW